MNIVINENIISLILFDCSIQFIINIASFVCKDWYKATKNEWLWKTFWKLNKSFNIKKDLDIETIKFWLFYKEKQLPSHSVSFHLGFNYCQKYPRFDFIRREAVSISKQEKDLFSSWIETHRISIRSNKILKYHVLKQDGTIWNVSLPQSINEYVEISRIDNKRKENANIVETITLMEAFEFLEIPQSSIKTPNFSTELFWILFGNRPMSSIFLLDKIILLKYK